MSQLQALKDANQDFEWYPTTPAMIATVARLIPGNTKSILDIGAGDARVLKALKLRTDKAKAYAIEKAALHLQSYPAHIVPVGTDFHQQDLTAIQVDVIFCNPPYSEYVEWASRIISSGYAQTAYLVIPQRWEDSPVIRQAIQQRGARTRVIYEGDFMDAERKARAKVHIVQVSYPRDDFGRTIKDPFDIWFDQNIDIFDEPLSAEDPDEPTFLERIKAADTLTRLVELYNMERGSMEENYKAIFQLDGGLLKELGIEKAAVRDGIKAKISGLKGKYWRALFDRMTMLTDRLTSGTRQKFMDKINSQTSVEFTHDNAHAIALWAVKNANKYYDQQLIEIFKKLSSPENTSNYASNKKTWEKEGWRFRNSDHTNYKLDYRIVFEGSQAIKTEDEMYSHYYIGNLHNNSHDLITDVAAVLFNLGYASTSAPSIEREWESGQWQDFVDCHGEIIFQVKAFKNGNLHFRFRQECMARLNVEAGRLLKWLKSPEQADSELGKGSAQHFRSNVQLGASKLLLD